MTHRFHRLWSVVVLFLPGAAYALGLGEIHLDSGLNQPLAAQIELIGASAEELTQLRATVASRDTFLRYGVDRPAFLSSITFKVGQDAAGRPVLVVHSTEAVTEPFVTFLVDVTWPRGKLTREYTLLLDPPVYESPATAESAPPVVQAPLSGPVSTPKSAPIVRDGSRDPVREARAADAPAGAYTVAANDTLSRIAERSGATSGADLNRAMIGIFRANPHAFDGNINRLRRGATLNIPTRADLESLSAAEASRAVAEQMQAWRGSAPVAARADAGGAATAPSGGRLKLVMPTDVGSGTADNGALKSKVQGLEKELAETKRLLELKNAELATLQKSAAAAKPAAEPSKPGKPVTEAAKPAPVTPPAVKGEAPKADAAKSDTAKADTAKADAAKADAAKGEMPKADAAAPADGAPDAGKAKKPRPRVIAAPAPAAAPGLFDSLGNYLVPLLGGAVLLLGAGIGFRFLRKRRAAGVSDTLGALDEQSALGLRDDDLSGSSFASRVHAEAHHGHDDLGGDIDPTSTISAETSINLEHADPLAEADFHMAYGLYDQAADIVKLAMEREPDRRDLRLKLLEVYFVWSNKDAFLDVARGLARDRDHAPAGEWDKVAIMGRQIAPDEPLFADAAGRGAAADGVDLDLAPDGHSDGPGMDLEFLGDDEPMHHDDVDLDLQKALAGHDALADTGQSLALKDRHVDFDLESTQERPQQVAGGPGAVRQGLEHTDTIDVSGLPPDPPPGHDGGTIREKLKAADIAALDQVGDQTAEIGIDDLDFEIEQLNATSMHAATFDRGAATMAALGAATTPALSADATRIAPRPDVDRSGGEPTRIAPRPAGLGGHDAGDATRLAPGLAAAGLNGAGAPGSDIDFDLEQLAATLHTAQEIQSPAGAHSDVDFDLSEDSLSHDAFNATHDSATAQIDASELAMHDLEPVTLSEVGTKIDLARAYMDMGDPDGARSILEEVLHEGSASQRQEAQRLMGGLPG